MSPPEPVFAEPWEAQAFAMAVKLHERGLFTWSEWTQALAAEIAAGDKSYYEHWLAALEKITLSKGLVSQIELELALDPAKTGPQPS